MRNTLFFLFIIMLFAGCRVKQSSVYSVHNSQNSLDWAGTYESILPCADCEGIETRLSLEYDNTYELQRRYLGKESDNVFTSTGSFEWNEEGSIITLLNEHKSSSASYFVGENYVVHLDNEGERITGDLAAMYVMQKLAVSPQLNGLDGMHWKFVQLYGETIDIGLLSSIPFLVFDADESRFSGNAGCNVINGVYQIGTEYRLDFSNVATTRKLCGHMQVEADILKLLKTPLQYEIESDTLRLYSNSTSDVLAKLVLQNKL